MLSAVVYLTLGGLLSRVEGPRRIKIYVLSVAVILTLLIGVSRVYAFTGPLTCSPVGVQAQRGQCYAGASPSPCNVAARSKE
jgi:hypothetical protein